MQTAGSTLLPAALRPRYYVWPTPKDTGSTNAEAPWKFPENLQECFEDENAEPLHWLLYAILLVYGR